MAFSNGFADEPGDLNKTAEDTIAIDGSRVPTFYDDMTMDDVGNERLEIAKNSIAVFFGSYNVLAIFGRLAIFVLVQSRDRQFQR